MKERLINIIKWFLIILGVIFLIQILIVLGAVIGISKFANSDMNINKNTSLKLKQMQPVINYAQDYYNKNGKYPVEIDNVKLNKNLEYKYETSKDLNCYTITTKDKKSNTTKQYQHCSTKSENSNSSSESYVEYSN